MNSERIERAAKAGYTHLLCYSSLRDIDGETYEEDLPFCSVESAQEFVRKINAKWDAGKISYRVTNHYVRDIRGLA